MNYVIVYAVIGTSWAVSRCSGIFYPGNIFQFNTNFSWVKEEIPSTISTAELIDEIYDFIIVGSGSAGSVIANRLSEIRNWKILLLEAGYQENSIFEYPFLSPLLQFTDYNWDYSMEPQDNICLAMQQKRCAWPRGKALGGSSVINYMIYTRGNPLDYDRWAAQDNPGWSYKDVLPYFLKSENSRLSQFNPRYHNQGGYLSVEDPYQSDLTKPFLKAGEELGYNIVDYNSPTQFGFSRLQATIKRGRRHSVARAFLTPIRYRKNLKILTGARVTKISIDSSTNKAEGVKFVRRGKQFSVTASKEVIISAGALSSPQLLMLSGIGPEDHLRELGITPILKNLPIGKMLYDHIGFLGLICNTNVTVEPAKNLYDPVQLSNWVKTGVGPLSSLGGFEALGYIKTNVSREKVDFPDVELILGGAGSIYTDYGLVGRRTFKVSDDFYYRMYLPLEGKPSFSIIPMLLHPKSKGYMKLRSRNPYDSPLFYGNYLTDPEGHDINTLIAGIRFSIKLCETDVFKKYNTQFNTKPLIGCEHLPFNSDDYWKCALTLLTSTLHHQTSTCKMGPAYDPTAVVNHELKVYGIGNLRVADTSIIPFALSAHTHAPSVMIGEKASDLIKEEWESTTVMYTLLLAFGSIWGIKGGYNISSFAEHYQRGLENILAIIENLFGGIAPITISTIPTSKDEEYDFIIIGSGSAGSVIANRLTEIESWKVLLLEAGMVESSLAQYPALATILQFSDYNWKYTMEPQDNVCLAMEDQRCRWPRGKALGGSTVINYMVYSRGSPEDYNNWAALGNTGWSYEDVLPYFLKSEDSRLNNSNPHYHNVGGYQSVENSFTSELADAFIEAGKELGYPHNDPNSPEQIGFSRFQTTTKSGRRHSTATAFLKPILNRENLHILTGAKVNKILIDPSTNRAYGVTYNKNDKKMFVTATKEVIVSAGALSSPQLLMLSGVGRRRHLEELGIATLSDLPVGETLYDHLALYGLIFNTNLTMGSLADLFIDSAQLTRWYRTGDGPLSEITGLQGAAFINSNSNKIAETYPDLEIVISSGTIPASYGVVTKKILGLSDSFYQSMYADLEGMPTLTMVPILLHPKSSGHMKLRSSDAYDHPLFYGNYLTDPENQDASTLIAGIKFIIKLSETQSFKKYGVRLNTKPFVGCEHLSFNSDEYWYCALQLTATTAYHPTSTCKMGPVDDLTAVVSPELKVYGIGNLRVADASIMPLSVSGHTNAPTIMIGEKASDLIKQEWGVL